MPMHIPPCLMSPRILFPFLETVFGCSGELHLFRSLNHPHKFMHCNSEVLYTKDGQPFLVGGSGTLGWDMV